MLQGIRRALLVATVLFAGCAGPAKFGERLATAIQNQDDPVVVRDGLPAYLLLVDSLILQDPDNGRLLRAGAELYSVYGAGFVQDAQRAKRLTDKGKRYAIRALCLELKVLCQEFRGPFDVFEASVSRVGRDDIPVLYTFGAAWASWIQVRGKDWDAVADIPRVAAIMAHVVATDEHYRQGEAHVYLGVLNTLLPSSLGGKPEIGRQHFERAIALSKGKNLMAKVIYAERYARLLYQRELHDQLLHEVIEADPHAPGFTLLNVMAQSQAEALLRSADEYF